MALLNIMSDVKGGASGIFCCVKKNLFLFIYSVHSLTSSICCFFVSFIFCWAFILNAEFSAHWLCFSFGMCSNFTCLLFSCDFLFSSFPVFLGFDSEYALLCVPIRISDSESGLCFLFVSNLIVLFVVLLTWCYVKLWWNSILSLWFYYNFPHQHIMTVR